MKRYIKINNIVIFAIFLSFFIFCGFKPANTIPNNLTTNIEFLSFNTLMAFPEKALHSKNNLNKHYDKTKLTPFEFENILMSLYNNNYILINIDDIYNLNHNKITLKPINLPSNKKPIILSFDNVNYKDSYQNTGEVDKIIIDRNNNLASYTTKKSIQDRVHYNNEFILILENFISEYPNFSHNNARGIIFLTGENGILGYNTNHNFASNKHESKRVSEVIYKLKSLGWKFGSNGYQTKPTTQTDIQFTKNLSLWNKEVRTLIGDTPLYSHLSQKEILPPTQENLLKENNFKVFFSKANTSNIELIDNKILINTIPINGKSLRENHKELLHLFDSEKIYDHTNRTIPYNNLTQ